ncbi:fatty acid-binding protein, liver-like [Saccostrea cucullata]|uniref:fatty acid-binding protein, liver-like n=1 Tax=Saccostrea cuccullata TaxID=36930 RepID=UPI002ED60D62
MANFVGTWEDTGEREGYEEFAKAMGLSDEMFEKFRGTKHTMKYSINGNTWTLNLSSTFFPGKEKTYTFEIGKEFCDTGLDGKEIKNTVTVVNDNEIQEDMKVKNDDSWREFKLTRTVDGANMTTIVNAFGKTMRSKQKRL